jgi:hypothetical protein
MKRKSLAYDAVNRDEMRFGILYIFYFYELTKKQSKSSAVIESGNPWQQLISQKHGAN